MADNPAPDATATPAATTEPTRPKGGRGQTLLRARWGIEYTLDLDGKEAVVTSAGLLVTQAQAEAALAAPGADEYLFVDTNDETKEG